MEKEAVIREHASLENQLVSLHEQINSLSNDVDAYKTKVHNIYC